MDKSFWHERWEKDEIGFHVRVTNPLLVEYFVALSLAPSSRVFLPLCGKTLDVGWLLSRGFSVIGSELSELAVRQMFEDLDITPEIVRSGDFLIYRAEKLEIWVGDFFNLSADMVGAVDAVYDRAALIALPDEMRARYCMHLADVSGKARHLLITVLYDQNLLSGPPFSVSEEEVRARYSDDYKIEKLASDRIPGGLKGKCPAVEEVYLLS